MKRMLIFMVVASLMLASQAFVAEVTPMGSAGALLQHDTPGQFGFCVGGDVPLVTRTTRGDIVYQIVQGTDYFYADRDFAGNLNEIQAIRTFTSYERYVYQFWYVGIGGGMWAFVNAEGSDLIYPSYRIKTGLQFSGFDFSIGCDIIQINGASDIYYPNVNLNILKL